MNKITEKFTLPCGLTVPNRIVKSAMTEGLASADGIVTKRHIDLYRTWAKSKAGILLTGNVQISATHLERAGNVFMSFENEQLQQQNLQMHKQWVDAVHEESESQLWMQISHGGRQTPVHINATPKAPSAVQLGSGNRHGMPIPVEEQEIMQIISDFANTAKLAMNAGFDGVQIHSAHGYLLSSFLSPRTNKRQDKWGGSLENRARLLLEVVKAMRAATKDTFAIGVKLNSADFQEDGFQDFESIEVAKMLQNTGVDLLELSGGNYESPAMMRSQQEKAASTIRREAYFLQLAEKLRSECKIPLIVTGGFRSTVGMNAALEDDVLDFVGVARPFCSQPDAVMRLFDDEKFKFTEYEASLEPKKFAVFWYYAQILRLAANKPLELDIAPEVAMKEVLADMPSYA